MKEKWDYLRRYYYFILILYRKGLFTMLDYFYYRYCGIITYLLLLSLHIYQYYYYLPIITITTLPIITITTLPVITITTYLFLLFLPIITYLTINTLPIIPNQSCSIRVFLSYTYLYLTR